MFVLWLLNCPIYRGLNHPKKKKKKKKNKNKKIELPNALIKKINDEWAIVSENGNIICTNKKKKAAINAYCEILREDNIKNKDEELNIN